MRTIGKVGHLRIMFFGDDAGQLVLVADDVVAHAGQDFIQRRSAGGSRGQRRGEQDREEHRAGGAGRSGGRQVRRRERESSVLPHPAHLTHPTRPTITGSEAARPRPAAAPGTGCSGRGRSRPSSSAPPRPGEFDGRAPVETTAPPSRLSMATASSTSRTCSCMRVEPGSWIVAADGAAIDAFEIEEIEPEARSVGTSRCSRRYCPPLTPEHLIEDGLVLLKVPGVRPRHAQSVPVQLHGLARHPRR